MPAESGECSGPMRCRPRGSTTHVGVAAFRMCLCNALIPRGRRSSIRSRALRTERGNSPNTVILYCNSALKLIHEIYSYIQYSTVSFESPNLNSLNNITFYCTLLSALSRGSTVLKSSYVIYIYCSTCTYVYNSEFNFDNYSHLRRRLTSVQCEWVILVRRSTRRVDRSSDCSGRRGRRLESGISPEEEAALSTAVMCQYRVVKRSVSQSVQAELAPEGVVGVMATRMERRAHSARTSSLLAGVPVVFPVGRWDAPEEPGPVRTAMERVCTTQWEGAEALAGTMVTMWPTRRTLHDTGRSGAGRYFVHGVSESGEAASALGGRWRSWWTTV